MSYVVGAFIVAAMVVAALIVPAFRLAAGLFLLIAGLVSTMFAMFFGPPVAAVGLAAVLLELYSRRAVAVEHEPVAPLPRRRPHP